MGYRTVILRNEEFRSIRVSDIYEKRIVYTLS